MHIRALKGERFRTNTRPNFYIFSTIISKDKRTSAASVFPGRQPREDKERESGNAGILMHIRKKFPDE